MEKREAEALQIGAEADFRELTDCYLFQEKYHVDGEALYYDYDDSLSSWRRTWVRMGGPSRCDRIVGERLPLPGPWKERIIPRVEERGMTLWQFIGEPWPRQPEKVVIPRVEERGITLRQLRAIKANADRRCVEEKWTDYQGNPLTPDKITMYDINKYVILPFTVKQKKSFVECLPSTTGTQPPKRYVSHWWGETTNDFLLCIKQCVISLGEDVPIWICAYANNQWNLDESITNDPDDSGFCRAMELAEMQTLVVVDKKGMVFERIWCIYEMYKAMVNTSDHSINPGASLEICTALPWKSGGECVATILCARSTSNHHGKFPKNLILKSLKTHVGSAKASKEADRRHILNAIVDNRTNLDSEPPQAHANYRLLDNAIHGILASSEFLLKEFMHEDDEQSWRALLLALSKSSYNVRLRLGDILSHYFPLQKRLELVEHFPTHLRELHVEQGAFDFPFLWEVPVAKAIAGHVCHLTDLTIDGYWTYGYWTDEREKLQAGMILAAAVASSTSLEHLWLENTDLVDCQNALEWGNALAQSKSLKTFVCFAPRKPLGDQGAKALADCIGHAGDSCCALEYLSLFCCGIGPKGIASFGPNLMKNKSIETVCFADSESKLWGELEWYLFSFRYEDYGEAVKALQEIAKARSPPVEIVNGNCKGSYDPDYWLTTCSHDDDPRRPRFAVASTPKASSAWNRAQQRSKWT